MRRWPAAWLRMCSSSPICSPCAASPSTSTGPVRSSSPASTGRARSRRKRWRSTASSSPTPSQKVRPGPSLSVENARTPARLVLDDPDRHRRRAHAGHRPHVAVLVAAREADLAVGEQLRRAVAVGGPALEQARGEQRAPLRVAHVGPRDRRARVQEHAVAEAGDDVARPRDRERPRAARARCARAPARWPASTRSPWRPQSASRSATVVRVAAGRRAPVDVDDLGALVADGVPEAVEPDVHRGDPLEHGVAHRLNPPRRSPDRRHPRRNGSPRCARPGLRAKRDLDLLGRLPGARALDGDDAAAIPHGDGFLLVCAEAIAPALVAGDPFAAGAAAVATNVSDIRAMGGRPLALVDTLVSPDRAHAGARARRARVGGRPARRPRRRRAPDDRRRARAVGVLHRDRPRPAARRERAPRRRAARRLLPRGRVPRPAGSADLHARCATAPPRGCATTARRSSRSPRPASAAPPATSRCPASPGSLLQTARADRRVRRDARPRPPPAPGGRPARAAGS